MGRHMLHVAGNTVNGYYIVARPSARNALVRCQHKGCTQTFEVSMAGVLNGCARKLCPEHKKLYRSVRVHKARMQREHDAQIARMDYDKETLAAMEDRVIKVKPLQNYCMSMQQPAVRIAREDAGLPWRSYRLLGQTRGWMMVIDRDTTAGGAVIWLCTCALCGDTRKYYEQQLARKPIPMCRACGTLKKWRTAQADFYARCEADAERRGMSMSNALTLLRYAHAFAVKNKADVPERVGIVAEMYNQLHDTVQREKNILQGELQEMAEDELVNPAPVTTVPREDRPYNEWTDDELADGYKEALARADLTVLSAIHAELKARGK